MSTRVSFSLFSLRLYKFISVKKKNREFAMPSPARNKTISIVYDSKKSKKKSFISELLNH